MTTSYYGIGFKTKTGEVIAYTGKAGEDAYTSNTALAFKAYSLQGVQCIGSRIQRQNSALAICELVAIE